MIKRFFIVVLILISIKITGQRNSSSPYSFFGIGEETNSVTVEQASMGGIGVATKDIYHLNFINPAAIADLRFATYGIGGELSLLNVSSQTGSASNNTTSLRYIALGVPIGTKAGFMAGLQPVSNVGYALLTNTLDASNNVTAATRFTGSGGSNRLFGAFGINVFKGLALGFEAGFVFGNINNNTTNQRRNVALSTKYERNVNVRGGQYKLGAQYKHKYKGLDVIGGIALQMENDFSVTGRERLYSFSFGTNGREIPRDTLFNRSLSSNLSVPLKTIIGAGIGKENKWFAGIDYETQGAFKNQGNLIQGSSYRFKSSNRLSLGGYYIPKINSISSYWDRITYRGGLRFEDVGLLVDGTGTGNNFTSITDFGINVGFGLPLPKQISNLNIGLEYGQKGTISNNLVKESYFNVRLSLSLNGRNWLQKRQID